MALLQLVDDFSSELVQKDHLIGIFIDLSKAFDTIDHFLLLKKPQHYGIRGLAFDWFTNYLSHRHQYVKINMLNCLCSQPNVKCLKAEY